MTNTGLPMGAETIAPGRTPRLCICVPTYKRPIGLARLLRSIDQLRFERVGEPAIEVIVVDNDPEASAATTCAELTHTSRWPIVYAPEPRRGIAFARNAAVRTAQSGGAELIAFIDDDEVPEATWLDELLAAMGEYQADFVAGPVLPTFEGHVPGWILKGKFFERPRHPTGTRLEQAATCNVLLRTRVFDELGHGFDEGLGLAGGEDTDFSLRAWHAGCVIVWADAAIAHEWNPVSRARTAWLLRRAYAVGNNWGAFDQRLHPRFRGAMRGLAKGLVSLPASVVRGRHSIVQSLQLVAVGVGYLAARAGFRFPAYRHTDGH